MLMFKAVQVIAVTKELPKDWEMEGRKGTSHPATACCLGGDGRAANLKIKAKSAEELTAKVAQLTIGKPFEFPVVDVVPVFQTGRNKPSGYEFVVDVKVGK